MYIVLIRSIFAPLERLEKLMKILMKMTTKKMAAEVNLFVIFSISETQLEASMVFYV